MGREGYRFGEEARMKPELMCEQNEKLVFIAIERELKTMLKHYSQTAHPACYHSADSTGNSDAVGTI